VQTLLYISPMETGDELPVREAHATLPVDVLDAGIGIDRLVAFIGSGYYALEITISDGDVQENFHRFLGTPAIQELFTALRPYVRELPAPDAKTADLPLATAMLLWQSGGSSDSTSV